MQTGNENAQNGCQEWNFSHVEKNENETMFKKKNENKVF